jgi:inosine-uridine nucleoside N-ribohydrolase
MTWSRSLIVTERIVPVIPPADQKIRLLIDSDAACEVDDHYAIALALLAPERFAIEGFVATHWGDAGGPEGTRMSAEDIRAVLAAGGRTGDYPVALGGDPLAYSAQASRSDGADLIVERAMAGSAEDPLWIVGLGACTNIASAWLIEPKIAERVRVFYHGRTQHWPERLQNFNIENDVRAFRVLLRSDLPLVLFDTGTHLTCPMSVSEQRIATSGPLGKHLHEIRFRQPDWQADDKGMFDLGDIAALLDPTLATWEETPVPMLGWDKSADFDADLGRMLRVSDIDRDGTFQLLFDRLQQRSRTA